MLNNLKIGTRLSCGFAVLLVLMVLVGGYAIKEIHELNDGIHLLVNDRMVKVEQANRLIDNINIVARAVRNLLLIDNDHNRADMELQRIAEARKMAGGILEEFDKTLKHEQAQAMLKKMATDIRPVFSRHLETLLDLVKNDRDQEAKTLLMGDFRQIQAEYLKTLDEFNKFVTDLAQKAGQEAGSNASNAVRVISIILVAALGLSVLLAFLLVRSITVPIRKAAALAEVMAQGDFTNTMVTDQKDEIGQMAKSVNSMATQVAGMIRNIIAGVDQLSAASNDMAAVSRQLSSAAKDTSDKAATVAAATEEMSTNMQSVSAAMEQSTSNVNMVASSTEEMTSTVGEIAQSAEKARAITESAVTQSRQTSAKMNALGESARKIGRVTETITEISEQTNLLALNATIDIKNQISDMQATTATTVEDIEKISTVIAEINNVINGIATAVEEQSAATGEIAGNIAQASQGIAEVNENVAQSTVVIIDITRDIAGINQQSAQVGEGSGQVQNNAQGLAQLAAQLEQLVKQFKV